MKAYNTEGACGMDYFPAFKKKDALIHAATWMNLVGIMLSWLQKDKHHQNGDGCDTVTRLSSQHFGGKGKVIAISSRPT